MRLFVFLAMLALTELSPAQTNLFGHAEELFRQAQHGKYYAIAAKLKPEYFPTSDGQSFLTIWRATGTNAPKHWIVSIHGTHGYATDDLAIWSQLVKGRDVGLVTLQWWLGEANGRDFYYTPEQVYHEIDQVLPKLGVRTNSVMFHGFSRGAANSYAIAALDHGRGKKYFALNVASSGGAGLDYPPTRAILNGAYGDHPLRGTHWVTCAGGRDPNPDRDGISGMRRTVDWLKEQGATVALSIEDQNLGHGALVTNPKNAERVLDLFLAQKDLTNKTHSQ